MPSRTLTPHGVNVLVKSVSMPILIVPDCSPAGSVAGSVAGASVAAGSVVGASVVGDASVAGASVAGAAVSAGEPHAVRIITKTRKAGIILNVILFFFFILPPISKLGFIEYR